MTGYNFTIKDKIAVDCFEFVERGTKNYNLMAGGFEIKKDGKKVFFGRRLMRKYKNGVVKDFSYEVVFTDDERWSNRRLVDADSQCQQTSGRLRRLERTCRLATQQAMMPFGLCQSWQ